MMVTWGAEASPAPPGGPSSPTEGALWPPAAAEGAVRGPAAAPPAPPGASWGATSSSASEGTVKASVAEAWRAPESRRRPPVRRAPEASLGASEAWWAPEARAPAEWRAPHTERWLLAIRVIPSLFA